MEPRIQYYIALLAKNPIIKTIPFNIRVKTPCKYFDTNEEAF